MTELEELREISGKAMGWVDYPSDSVEHGSIWHLDKDTAPFGRILHKADWRPHEDDSDCTTLEAEFRVDIIWSAMGNRLSACISWGNTTIRRTVELDECGGNRKAARRLAVLRAVAAMHRMRQ